MVVWSRFLTNQKEQYIKFLSVYGALSNLFRQKQGSSVPYLDSKFQETIFARVFEAQIVDIGNTPHDILCDFGDKRIGIGLKTWMGSSPSYQKVMQLKRYQQEILECKNIGLDALAYKISQIKNERMISDYMRLGLNANENIYHYITRDKGSFTLNECEYPLIRQDNLQDFNLTHSAFSWSDGIRRYKYTFADSQIWQFFDSSIATKLNTLKIDIIEDPFDLFLQLFSIINSSKTISEEYVEVFLPLYSYRTKEVETKSGLNAWNSAPKNKFSSTPRPLNEVYIPIPIEFHHKHPDFFVRNIFDFERQRNSYEGPINEKPEVRFNLILPNGKRIPSLVTQSNMKALQSGSNTERDEDGKRIGQGALGQWLLIDVLGLKERALVTREWLQKKGSDSVRLWRRKDDYHNIYIDIAPIGSFEAFMQGKPISEDIADESNL